MTAREPYSRQSRLARIRELEQALADKTEAYDNLLKRKNDYKTALQLRAKEFLANLPRAESAIHEYSKPIQDDCFAFAEAYAAYRERNGQRDSNI